MADNKEMPMGKAQVDFICVEDGCDGQIVFKLAERAPVSGFPPAETPLFFQIRH